MLAMLGGDEMFSTVQIRLRILADASSVPGDTAELLVDWSVAERNQDVEPRPVPSGFTLVVERAQDGAFEGPWQTSQIEVPHPMSSLGLVLDLTNVPLVAANPETATVIIDEIWAL